MPVGLEMVLILGRALDIHVACKPIAIFDARLGTPMGPDAKLRVTKPVRNAVSIERTAGALERPGGDGGCNRVGKQMLRLSGGRGIAKQFERAAPCNLHTVKSMREKGTVEVSFGSHYGLRNGDAPCSPLQR